MNEGLQKLTKETIDLFETIVALTVEIAEELVGIVDTLANITEDLIREVVRGYNTFRKTQPPKRWARLKNTKIVHLLLDRRRKVHRCRSSC